MIDDDLDIYNDFFNDVIDDSFIESQEESQEEFLEESQEESQEEFLEESREESQEEFLMYESQESPIEIYGTVSLVDLETWETPLNDLSLVSLSLLVIIFFLVLHTIGGVLYD